MPVETTVNGSLREARWGTSEAFESCAPQTTRTSGESPVAAATAGLSGPSVSQARRIGGKRRVQPCRSTRLDRRPSFGRQRSVCAASDVTSVAITPLSRQDQYCGQARKARAAAKASGNVPLEIKDLPPEIEPARARFGASDSSNGGRSAS